MKVFYNTTIDTGEKKYFIRRHSKWSGVCARLRDRVHGTSMSAEGLGGVGRSDVTSGYWQW